MALFSAVFALAGAPNVSAIDEEAEQKQCVVVSRSGRKAGDEVACGGEHFYILSIKNGKVRMLAKNNLASEATAYRVKPGDGENCEQIHDAGCVMSGWKKRYY